MLRKSETTTALTSLFSQPVPIKIHDELPAVQATDAPSLIDNITNAVGWFNPFKNTISSSTKIKILTAGAVLMNLVPKAAAICFMSPVDNGKYLELNCHTMEYGTDYQLYQELVTQCGAYQLSQGQICPHKLSEELQKKGGVIGGSILDGIIGIHSKWFGESLFGSGVCELTYFNDLNDPCTLNLLQNATPTHVFTKLDSLPIAGITLGSIAGLGCTLFGIYACVKSKRAANESNIEQPTEKTALVAKA